MVQSRFYEHWCAAGLACCLTWNIIATTTAWIKGEGQYLLVSLDLLYIFVCRFDG